MIRAKTLSTVYVGLFAAFIAICSWIVVPYTIPFTMQTFAVFAAVGILGWKKGTLSVLVYILIGALGVPVFAGFNAGVGALLGVTGGYILGFLASAFVSGALMHFFGNGFFASLFSMVAGLLVCYFFGTAWYIVVYTGEKSIWAILAACVLPYVVFDLLKILLAVVVSARLRSLLK